MISSVSNQREEALSSTLNNLNSIIEEMQEEIFYMNCVLKIGESEYTNIIKAWKVKFDKERRYDDRLNGGFGNLFGGFMF